MDWEDIKEMPMTNLREELLTLLDKEVEYAALLSPSRSNTTGDDGEPQFHAIRRNVCQWNYECVDYFLFDRDVVYLSMHYFDRYVAARHIAMETRNATSSSSPSVALSHLLALSSLYLACKLHSVSAESPPLPESPPHPSTPAAGNSSTSMKTAKPRIRLQDFCSMSRGAYRPEMLEEMELAIMTNLGWRLSPPTPTDFLIRFAKILSILLDDDRHGQGWSVFEVSRYQIELAVYGPKLCKKFPPSKIALAAILNAMDSKVVKTKRTIIPSDMRRSFLQRVEYLGGGFGEMNFEGEDMVEIRTTLKKLCSKTIRLPGQMVETTPSRDIEFTPISAKTKSFEYELPEVHSESDSPVSVATDRLCQSC